MTDARWGNESRTLILVLADVEGFGNLKVRFNDEQLFGMLCRMYDRIGLIVARHGGRVVNFIGDRALAVFPPDRPHNAVAAMDELKREAAGLWYEAETPCRLRCRATIGRVACGFHGPDHRFDVAGRLVDDLLHMPAGGPELSSRLQALIGSHYT